MDQCINEYVELRLEMWARWYATNADFGLGYPNQSLEGRVISNGGVLIRSFGSKPLHTNESAEEIESLVCVLSRQNEKLANALREYYFGQGTVKQRAKKINTSCTQFKVFVDMAKQWLIGRLTINLQ
jgi:hypothetical protein